MAREKTTDKTTNSKASQPALIVGDDQARRTHWRDRLTQRGFTVIAVGSGQEAVDVLKHDRPGAILVDATLCDTDGWQLAERIRTFDTTIPIILVDHENGDSTRSTLSQVQAVLPHDVPADMLVKEMDRWFQDPSPPTRQQWPGTILVVDDEPKLCNILQRFLEAHGFRAVTVNSGDAAVAHCERSTPDAVLLDIKMPGMDGLEALQKIRALHPTITVIMITGIEEEQTMQEALASGAHDYILKPFNLKYLETMLLSKMLLGHAT